MFPFEPSCVEHDGCSDVAPSLAECDLATRERNVAKLGQFVCEEFNPCGDESCRDLRVSLDSQECAGSNEHAGTHMRERWLARLRTPERAHGGSARGNAHNGVHARCCGDGWTQ